MGGPGGGPLQVSLDQDQFDELSTELFQQARLPLDQACWTAGASCPAHPLDGALVYWLAPLCSCSNTRQLGALTAKALPPLLAAHADDCRRLCVRLRMRAMCRCGPE